MRLEQVLAHGTALISSKRHSFQEKFLNSISKCDKLQPMERMYLRSIQAIARAASQLFKALT